MRTVAISLLLVEDNPGDARLLREMLDEGRPHKITMTHVQTLAEAEAFVSGNHVDMILLDLGLPDAQGAEAVARATAAAPHVPLVVLTGSDDEALAGQALQAGAQDYLIKGQLDSRGLIRALRYAMERNAMAEALFIAHERTQVALDCIGDAVACTDVAGNITFLNRVAETMTGRSSQEAVGMSIGDVFVRCSATAETASPGCDQPLLSAARRGETIALAWEVFSRPDGSVFDAEYSSAPMRDFKGALLGATIAIRDVSERRAMERLKDEFVSTVSHELRTPLTSIRGALGLLNSGSLGALPDKGMRMLHIAMTNTDRLVRLINDILDIERLDSGKIELHRVDVDAQGLLELAIDGIQAMAESAGVAIALEPMRHTIFVDSDRIVQTVTNLLSNAIKFSAAGTAVTISAEMSGAMLVVKVADHGRGIPEDKRSVIFERFKQVDASDSREKGGSGLGLAITTSIVLAHGGTIWTERNGEQGSIFLFTVPLSMPPLRPDHHDADSLEDAPIVVLVVEDDEDLAGVMVAVLQARGVRALRAATGMSAVEIALRERPHVMVLDVNLPGMDGYGVVRALQADSVARHVPVLVYSALELNESERQGLSLGPTAFLTKTRGSIRDFEVGIAELLDRMQERVA
jgi:PAS domain S-box-containing protein